MKQLFWVLVLAVFVVVALAMVAPGLPEGNALRGVGEGVRAFGRDLAGGFGGGYRPVGP